MKPNILTTAFVAIAMAGISLVCVGTSEAQAHKPGMKHSTKQAAKPKTKKPSVEVKYKAECGMVYSAAEAKKNKYICPMDKKPLKKITVAKKGK